MRFPSITDEITGGRVMVGCTTGGSALAAEPMMLSITPPAVARSPILLAAPQPISTGGSTSSRISAAWRGMFVGRIGLPSAPRLLAKDPLRRAPMGAGEGGGGPGATTVPFHS